MEAWHRTISNTEGEQEEKGGTRSIVEGASKYRGG
jgi:hypothetical protein